MPDMSAQLPVQSERRVTCLGTAPTPQTRCGRRLREGRSRDLRIFMAIVEIRHQVTRLT